MMAVYNERPYLEKAVRSILDQTLDDFELIIVNDGSTDGSKQVLESLAERDDRVRLVHQENQGLITSLNRGLHLACGTYIARMDGDDVSHPERFERQAEFLRAHPGVGGIGTAIEFINAEGQVGEKLLLPTDPEVIAWKLLFNNYLCHPTMMVRRSLLSELGGYVQWARLAEDYEIWTRAVQKSRLANLSDVLLRRRHHKGSVTVSERSEQIRVCGKIAARYHEVLLGRDARRQLAKFLVWVETEGAERAVEETCVRDFAAAHRYVRLLYRAYSRHMGSGDGKVSVRRVALPFLDTLADRVEQKQGCGSAAWYKARARFMSPTYEVLPWMYQAASERLSVRS
jgi:glycosyltransferase involved in cell wall biosynthesis